MRPVAQSRPESGDDMAGEPPAAVTPQDNDDQPPAGPAYASRPPDAVESTLRQKFAERYAAQSEQMDALARQMVTIELAVPGLYAAILALVYGDKATVPPGVLLFLTFGLWALALALTFAALFPRNYRVDPGIQRADPTAGGDVLGVEDFFRESAAYKRNLLAAAAVVFWAGIIAALFLLFSGSGVVVPPPAP